MTREGGCLGGLAHGPYDHYLGKITVKHCLAMGRIIGRVCSVTFYTEVHHNFAFLRVTSKPLPQTASDLHLPSCVGSHVLPLQPKIQGCDPPPHHLARLNSSQARRCCSLCRGSEGQARSTQLSNSNTKLGTPAGLMVLCSQGKF